MSVRDQLGIMVAAIVVGHLVLLQAATLAIALDQWP